MHFQIKNIKKNNKKTCVPTLPKFFRPVTQNTFFYLALANILDSDEMLHSK